MEKPQQYYSRIKLTNGFSNHIGFGTLLACIILQGEVSVNDFLILNDSQPIPILEVEDHQHITGKRNIVITIPRKYDQSVKWFKLYGTELKIKNTTNN